MEQEDYGNAVNYFRQAIQEDTCNGYALFWLAALLSDDQPELALSCFYRAANFIPKKDKYMRGNAYLYCGHLFNDYQMYQYAMENYHRALKIDKRNILIHKAIAELYATTGQYEEADKAYREILKRSPNDMNAMLGLACNAYQRNDLAEGLKQIDKTIALYPEFSEAYSARAAIYFQTKEPDLAAQDIVTALSLDDNTNAYTFIRNARGKESEAVQLALRKRIMQEPNEGRWYYYLATAAESNGELQKAIDNYKIVDSLEKEFSLNDALARCHTDLGDYPMAIHYATLALSEDPDDVYTRMRRMLSYDELGQYELAIQDADTLVSFVPNDAHLYCNRAQLQRWNRHYEKALIDYEKAIDLDSTMAIAYQGRALCLHALGRDDEARHDFVLATRYEKEPGAEDISQIAYFYLGNRNEAVKIQEHVLESRGHDPNALFTAVTLYSLLGDNAKALNFLKQALDNGFHRYKLIRTIPELEELRQLPEFEEMMKAL